MATRSTIALEFADGTVGQVYCHFDGYLDHNGKILLEYYSDPFKLQRLIDLGDLSSLNSEIGEKHDFDERNVGCTFYGRDRDEDDIEANYFKTFEEYLAEGQREEFNYILRRDGVWYVEHDYSNGNFVPLMHAVNAELAV